MIMPSNEYHRTLLMISQYWFGWGLGAVRQQAITEANVDSIPFIIFFFIIYLSGRRQNTMINGVNSTLTTNIWASQGSVSGPLILLCTVTTCNAVVQNDIRLVSDDTALCMRHSNLNTLTLDTISTFDDLSRWCISNKLTVNAWETNFILFILSTNRYLKTRSIY